jgi:DNA (cytosine-5)-methyltransferase 1
MSNRWRGTGGQADQHIDLIPATRARLIGSGLPYVIENVPGAKHQLRSPVELTGEMFGLGVHRPRLFESNVLILAPARPRPAPNSIGVYGRHHDGRLLWRRSDGTEQHAAASLEEAQAAMEMPWADWRGCAEAIPPAYTQWIGHQLLAHIGETNHV